ncbi:restriction endonuclease subunit S, partial [Chromobacterium amazonense]|uniref:restriction endonuclease subunit S n=1 Tax=Chromobacterium amazonense TaxID=1382803 RepID=UPI003F78E752
YVDNFPSGSPEYWFYQLKAVDLANLNKATAIPGINRNDAYELEVLVPPHSEQKRIADKLDSVLARVDACRERLARVQPLLKRFRQSVLAAATSGRLTEDWRAERAPDYKSGAPISDGDLVDQAVNGQQASTPSATSAAGIEPASVSSNLTEWRNVRLKDVISEMRNGLSPKPSETPPGAKILRISAVRSGRIDFNDHRFLEVGDKERIQYSVSKGDLLFTRYNGSLDFVGVCALVRELVEGFVYPDKLIRVKVDESVASAAFVELAFGAPEIRIQIENFVKSSAGQKGISGGDLKSVEFSLPPLVEQHEIVRRVETLFAFADRLEARLAAAQGAADKLTPALLAKAFRGELVPQDPNDEPAAELLKRLAAQRAAAPKPKRGRKAASAGD